MQSDVTGRLVEIKTKFHTAATRPGGVSRGGATIAAERSVADLTAQVEQQLGECVEPLIGFLRRWPEGSVAEACGWAARVRDLAGLAGMHLLTEVAMHSYDCLDAVLVDGSKMERAEAVCFADALGFAQQGLCKVSDLERFRPLLKDLEKLTTLVIERTKVATA